MEDLNILMVAKRLTELRKENNLTQAQLADKLNYSDKAVSKWENGESLPPVEIFYKLSKLYGVSLDYIVGLEDKKAKPVTDKTRRRRIYITLLSVLAVWTVATICYNCFDLTINLKLWQLFCWAVPLSLIITIVFDIIWNKHRLMFIFISLLLWSVLICLSLQFSAYNIWSILVVGIPLQIGVYFWSRIMK